jgi:hypothetical protein
MNGRELPLRGVTTRNFGGADGTRRFGREHLRRIWPATCASGSV